MIAVRAARVVAVLLAGAAVAAAGCSDDDGDDVVSPQQAPTAGWTTYRDTAHGLQVQFPSDWRRARRSLTPNLADPRELLSVGTGPLPQSTRGACAHRPVGALEALGPRDAFVSVQERRTGGGDYPPRPRRFSLNRSERAERLSCVGEHEAGRLDTWWIPFGDSGRRFYALVAIGADAPAARRADTRRVLDSLRFSVGPPQKGG